MKKINGMRKIVSDSLYDLLSHWRFGSRASSEARLRGYFLRLALMTLGSCAMRPSTCDSCGSPVIDISIRI
jgi:hypothetical protein